MSDSTQLKYSVIVRRCWANENGSGINCSSEMDMFDEREDAIRHGFRQVGSDDFNVGVWGNDTLVSLDWMAETVEIDRQALDEVMQSLNGGW